ncbi:uncharacterized protein LOC122019457 [Zingiber officinale]|uniref:uncharacterized protein LOC122019457 n=1 Tax=Zingiber officinale TaxID=94328 RepID=UPI001C4AECF7|nr:uncharacterized protein LOC122019457 [Zingiber officinale]
MSEDLHRSRENNIREFWRNEMWEDAEDDVDRMMITLLEKEEQRRQETRSSRRATNRRYVDRDREDRHVCLVRDYFSDVPTFHAEVFRRRFRMRRELFVPIVDALTDYSEYFQWRRDAIGRKGLSPLQKCTAAIRQLTYASPADSLDEYVRMGERTSLDCLINFCRCMIDVYGARYLRRPNAADTQRLLQMHEQRHDFLGKLGSLDCMHWEWRNCPITWKG